MSYLDSNVFIYPILYAAEVEPKAKKAIQILQAVERGERSACTSTLTWDEVVWVVSKTLGRGDGISQGHRLLGFPNLEFINVDESILSQAQDLMAKYSLSPRDSLHAASALDKKIRSFVSDDKDFDQVKELMRVPI